MTIERAEAPVARFAPRRAILFWCVVWGLAAIGAAWLARSVDWGQARAAMAAADPTWIFLAFFAVLLGVPMWVLAWRLLLAPSRRPSFATMLEAQAVSLAAIQTFSVLGGGATAIYMLTRRAGLSPAAVISLLTFDQLLTGVVKLIIIGAALVFAPAPPFMRTVVASLLGVMVLLLAGVLALAHFETIAARWARDTGGLIGKAFVVATELAGHLAAIRGPARVGGALALYLVRRSMEGVAALCVQRACGATVSPEAALLIVAALSVATIVPGPPGNLGIYEAAVVFAYVACGVSPDRAIAMALLQHVAYLAACVLPGYATLLVRPPWKPREKLS